MNSSDCYIQKYQEKEYEAWDKFVLEESVNGTFLQTRKFLNYHPKDRFRDDSLLFFDKKGHLIATCPACKEMEKEKKVFYSHKGSTYGGLLIGKKYYNVESVIAIIEQLDIYLKNNKYDKVYLKITPDIFSKKRSDLIQFALEYMNYQSYGELNLYVPFNEYKADILSNFSQGKRTNIHNCEKAGIRIQQLYSQNEISIFYQILSETLAKYNISPIHSIEELYDFANVRLRDECEFYGAYIEDEMIAGSMMFIFEPNKSAHAQYLCAKKGFERLSPMSYMYYSMLKIMKERGIEKVSWGITTENCGRYLNMGLAKSKEAYGSSYLVNRTYYKEITG